MPEAGRCRRPGEPGHDQGRVPVRRSRHLLGPGLRTGSQLPVGRAGAHTPHPVGPVGRPDRGGPGHRPADRFLRRGHLVRPADRHPARHQGPRTGLPGHAHRDVGAPRGGREHGDSCPAGGAGGEPDSGPARRWRRGIGADGRAGGDSGGGRPDPGRTGSAGRPAMAGGAPDATSARDQRGSDGRRDQGGDRPGPLHRQPLVRQAGLRRSRRAGPPGGLGGPDQHQHRIPARPGRNRGGAGRDGGRDGAGGDVAPERSCRHRHGRGGGRLQAQTGRRPQAQESRRAPRR